MELRCTAKAEEAASRESSKEADAVAERETFREQLEKTTSNLKEAEEREAALRGAEEATKAEKEEMKAQLEKAKTTLKEVGKPLHFTIAASKWRRRTSTAG